MEDDSSFGSGTDNLRANWTPSQDEYFLELLLSNVHKGNKTGKAFTRQAWTDMIDLFNTKFGFKYDVDVLKNRYKRFKKQYNEIKVLVNQNGFKWDGSLNMVVADDKTWSAYIKVHPDAQAYRTKVVPQYDDLCIICGHAIADGRYSLSCFDVDFECEEIASKEMDDQISISKGVDDQTPSSVTNHHKIDWSPMMDQFFVELMLEQVRKGNKIGRTFKKKAWADMIESFNERFRYHYGKVVLKNRFNVLRRHYCSIKVLLAKEGFSWDETQQMLVADDQLWNKCIRVNHNFRLYKTKSMSFYPGMCIICRNEAIPGRKKVMSYKANLEKGSSEGKNPTQDTQLLPDVDKGAPHIVGEKDSNLETHRLLDANRGERNVSDHLKKHLLETPQSLKESKKARNKDEGMANVLKNMAVAVTSLTKKTKKEDNFSIDNVIGVLQSIPDMDDDLILDACDFLEDERRARMFLALDANLRKKWLLRKLRPE